MKKFILDLISLQLSAVIVLVPSSGFAQVAVSEIGEKPSVTPEDNPSYNPSEDEKTKLQIPSISDKPTGSPTEGSPQGPDLKNVPFGKPGNLIYHDSTKVTSSESPSTTKLDLLDQNSDLDPEKVLNLNNEELAEIDKILGKSGENPDMAKKAVEIANRVKTLHGVNQSQGKKVLKLITEQNLDHDRLDKLDGKSLSLISDLTIDSNLDGEKALQVAELGGEAALKLISEKKLDLDKLSKRNSTEISLINSIGSDATKAEKALGIADKLSSYQSSSESILQRLTSISATNEDKTVLFLDGLASLSADKLASRTASFIKVTNNPLLVSSLNQITTTGGVEINPVSRLMVLNDSILDQIGSSNDLSDKSQMMVVDIIQDNFKPTGSTTSSKIQYSDLETLGSSSGQGTLGKQLVADLTSSSSSEELAKEMEEMIPPILALNGDAYIDKITSRLVELSALPVSQRRVLDPVSTDDYKAAVRDVFVDDLYQNYSFKINSDELKKLFDLSNSSSKDLYLEAMSSGSLASLNNNVELILPDELDAVSLGFSSSNELQLSNLRSRMSSVRLAQMGFPVPSDLMSSMIARSVADAHAEENQIAQSGSGFDQLFENALSDKANSYKNGFFTQASFSFIEDDYYMVDGNSWGLTMGIDQEIYEGFTAGIMGGIGQADSDGVDSNIETESLYAGVYANYVFENYYLEGLLNFGFHNGDASRAGLNGKLTSSPNSTQHTGSLSFGRIILKDSFLITPSLTLTYDNLVVGDYHETGGSGAHSIHEQNYENFTSALGLKIAKYNYFPEGGAIVPEWRAFWQHEFNDEVTDLNVELLNTGNSYSIDGRPRESDFGIIGAGFTSISKDGKSLYMHYDYMLGKEDFNAHFLNLGFRILF